MKNELLKFTVLNNASSVVVNTITRYAPRVLTPVQNNIMNWVQHNVCCYFEINGHFDSYISKSMTSILENKYLSKKYGSTLIDVDPAFALCTASLEKVKKKVSCFPELVNKTIASGIYSLQMDKDGTKMILVRMPVISKDDRSENGIISGITHYNTGFIFVGKNREHWFKYVRKEIDDLVSSISKTNQGNGTVRYRTLSASGDNNTGDMKVRPMHMLSFPEKDQILSILDDFVGQEKLYKNINLPYRKGFLLGGKPGTGKTAFAFSVPQYYDMDVVSVNLDAFDKTNGDNAFSQPNTVYIIDEIDSQLVNRAITDQEQIQKTQDMSRRLLQLLRAMDSMDGGSIVIATTNYPERLDPALRRSGRFDYYFTFKDIDETYARKMIMERESDLCKMDPDEILKDKTFPINPAELEKIIVEYILKKNNMVRKVASFDELGLAEEVKKEEENKIVDAVAVADDDDDEESSDAPRYHVPEGSHLGSDAYDDEDDDEDEDEEEE